MSISKNDWLNEQDRVKQIQREIQRRVDAITENAGELKGGIIELRKNFWEDVTINLDDVHEVGETFTSIKQQVELLSERERTHNQIYKQLQNLKRLASSPYFGRIDFKEEGEQHTEQIYVGVASLMDERDEEFLIYDWRAPISSLYYNYSPGPAEYEVPEETIHGEVELKRQYIIKYGQLKSMFDTGVTIGDELLQEVLSNNANTQMKSIVATIQKEQNQIIRNEKSRYLVVQGVAGSGKTSAALQRVAYLLYRFRNQINADNIMLFSPNYLFNSYVATVLPELGEENMQQTTFQSYVGSRLEKDFAVEDPFEQMEYIYSNLDDGDYNTRMKSIQFKSADAFKQILDRYLSKLSENGIIFKDIRFRGGTLFSEKQVNDYFYSLDRTITIPNRVHLTAEWLLVELAKIQKQELKKDWVREESELLDKEEYLQVFREIEGMKGKNEDSFNDYEKEERLLAKYIVKKRVKPIKNAIKKFLFLNIKEMYRRLFTSTVYKEISKDILLPTHWEDICSITIDKLDSSELMYEDTTPYLYFKDQLEGRKPNTTIRHLFIDEAQDYSPFQFAFFQQLFPNARMTILGDLNQAIFAHTMSAPSLLSPEVFNGSEHERITLRRSYRSTRQIVEFTKGLIHAGGEIEPFNRDGNLPTICEVKDHAKHQQEIVKRVQKLQEEGHTTIAIICKTAKESMEAYEAMKTDIPIHFMGKEAHTFNKGILVLPAYLAKGIEFDAVVIYNASNERYGKESERKLFYTACTRAMHELHIFSLGEMSYLIERIDEETYERRTC